jgi:hypothetical protein
LQAIQTGLPVFAFVDSGVMRDHLTYEKNKNKPIITQIEFSSIDKSETAPYIFEFINFLRMRNENNSIFEFSRFEDIEAQLKKQWAGLFQRLLHEQRARAVEGRRIDNLSGQIADLKSAVLGSISNGELKATAKGAIRFRLMIDFLSSLAMEYRPTDVSSILHSDRPWGDLIRTLGIIQFRPDSDRGRFGPLSMILIREDETYYRVRQSIRSLQRLEREWADFQKLGADAKDAILNAVLDSREGRPTVLVRHYNEPFVEDGGSAVDDDSEFEPIGNRDSMTGYSRILLTQNKFIEETIKNHLVADPNFENMKFLVDVDNEKVTLTRISMSNSGRASTFHYPYSTPEDGKLNEEIARLKTLINLDLNKFEIDHVDSESLIKSAKDTSES